MAERAATVVVLGQRGLTRDVVQYALGSNGLAIIDLNELDRDASAPIVVVLVTPGQEDWAIADDIGARIIVVRDRPSDPRGDVDVLVRGASAVLGSDVELEDLLRVVEEIGSGQPSISQAQASEAVDRLRRRPAADGQITLTPREVDVLVSIDRGEGVKQTARHLHLSDKTVQNVQSRLFRKLGARNRAQAVSLAHELQLLPGSGAHVTRG